jgi:YVTN family beta-propeller protein
MMRFCILLLLTLAIACDNAAGPGTASIRLDPTPDSLQLLRNGSAHIAVTALDRNGQLVTGVAVTFTSADTSIATVNNSGIVATRMVLGRTTVRASGGGTHVDVPVAVVPGSSGVIIEPTDTTLRPITSVQFRATVLDEFGAANPSAGVTWESLDTSIATISATGVATTKSKPGMATISARHGIFVAGVTLRVAMPGVATRVTIGPLDTIINPGGAAQLTATAYNAFGDPVPGVPIQWYSYNLPVASISSTGLVHAEGPTGIAIILASIDTDSATARVTVLDSLFVDRKYVAGSAFGADISKSVAYVGLTEGRLLRANLPSHAFTDSVTVGNTPTGIAFNSTGTRAYVANQFSSNVSVVDVSTNSVIQAIPVGSRPLEVIVAPGDGILYVAKVDSVYGILLANQAIVFQASLAGSGSGGLAIARDTLLYVSIYGAGSTGSIIEFNLRTGTPARTFAGGGAPHQIAVSPDGNELYSANENGFVQFWDLNTGQQIGSNLWLPTGAYELARRPSNGLLYVTSSGYVYVVDPVSRTLINYAVVGGVTRQVAFSADGSIGIVANENGWVDFIK